MTIITRKVISGSIAGLAYRFKDDFASEGGVPTTPWYALEPNSYADYGGTVTTVARSPINRSRQRKKGAVTDFDASGGINHDWTQHQLTRVLQAFFYADIFEKPTTLAISSTGVPITGVTAASGYAFDNDPSLGFLANNLVFAQGFNNPTNNGPRSVTSVSTGAVAVTPAAVDEPAPPAGATLKAIGFQFPVGDVTLDAQAGQVIMTATATNMTTLGLHPGEWVFLGGDTLASQFAGNTPGYARVSVSTPITSSQIVFDKTTWAPADAPGTGKTIQMFMGDFLRNMTEAEIEVAGDYERFIMDIERTLGRDANGIQSQILEDCFANALTYTQPLSDKVTVDMTFVALNEYFRDGTDGLEPGVRVPGLGEAAFNTSTCLVRARMSLLVPGTINPTPLFAFVNAVELTIENNVTAVKAQGDIGGIDVVEGDFAVGGSATVYFSTVESVAAVRNYSDVTFDVILAQRNAGYVFDLPLLGLGDGRLNVTKDEPITVPLGLGAFENAGGYTASYTNFAYLPNAAMPIV